MRRPGLTLLQLVTVLAMCGILACLLTPGLNSAQEEKRRGECSKKLHEFGVAILNYHDVNGFLPPGEGGHSNGVFAFTMPYTEQESMVKTIIGCDGDTFATWISPNLAIDKGAGWWTTPASMTLCRSLFADYVCPSIDPALFKSKQANSVAAMRYSVSDKNSAVMTLKSIDPGLAATCTYAACAGVSGHTGVEQAGKSFGDWREGMFTANSNWSFPMILDGTSNTLSIGEYLGNYNAEIKEWTMRGSWAGAQTMWTAKNLAAKPQEATWDRFSGPHPDVTLFTMGDASVRAIRNSIELEVLRDLSGMREGHIVNFDDTNK